MTSSLATASGPAIFAVEPTAGSGPDRAASGIYRHAACLDVEDEPRTLLQGNAPSRGPIRILGRLPARQEPTGHDTAACALGQAENEAFWPVNHPCLGATALM